MLWELDEFKPAQFLGFIREIPEPLGYRGQEWLPNLTVDDLNFEYILGANRRTAMAHIVSFDAESPIASRPGLGEKVAGELPPIKRKGRIGEKEIIRFLSPRSGSADVDAAIASVYQLAADLNDSVSATLEYLRMRALSEPSVVYNEGVGPAFEFDFGLTKEFLFDFTTGEDGTGASVGTPGSLSDPDFNVIPWLQMIANLVQQRTGRRPTGWTMSVSSYNYLLTNNTIRALIRGPEAPSTVLTATELQTVFSLYTLPVPDTYDAIVTRELPDGTLEDVRPMAENRSFFHFGDTSFGNTLLGPTAESRVLYGTALQASAPGVWAETYNTTEPPAEWTKVAAVSFPTMPGANRLAQARLW